MVLGRGGRFKTLHELGCMMSCSVCVTVILLDLEVRFELLGVLILTMYEIGTKFIINLRVNILNRSIAIFHLS
jgi:hypothetical protein